MRTLWVLPAVAGVSFFIGAQWSDAVRARPFVLVNSTGSGVVLRLNGLAGADSDVRILAGERLTLEMRIERVELVR